VDATEETGKLYDVLGAVAAALMVDEKVTAMDALAELEAEAAGLRERLNDSLQPAGSVPLLSLPAPGEPGELPPPSATASPGKTNGVTPPLGDDRVRVDGRRRRGSEDRRHRW
jgi:hypothetical protein